MGIFRKSAPPAGPTEEELSRQTERVRKLLHRLTELEESVERSFNVIQEQLDSHGKTVRLMAEEMEERIDRGNTIWRRIRAAQRYEERVEEDEGQPDAEQLFLGDASAGAQEGMPSMYGDMAYPGEALKPWQQVARSIAHQIAGKRSH